VTAPTFLLSALAPYGATVAPSGFIARDGRELGAKPTIRKGRLRIESRTGALLFTGPPTEDAVRAFVTGYWFWTVRP